MTSLPTGQYVQAQRASVEATWRIAADMFTSFEKLVQLNMRMAKTSLEANQARWLSALSGKGPLAFFEVPTGTQPIGEQVAAYNRQVYDVLTVVHKSLVERMGAQYERQAREVQADVDEKARSGPFGSEVAVEALKSMISATSSWYNTLYRTACQAVETAESGMDVATGPTRRGHAMSAHTVGGRK
jgi:phasin family protein